MPPATIPPHTTLSKDFKSLFKRVDQVAEALEFSQMDFSGNEHSLEKDFAQGQDLLGGSRKRGILLPVSAPPLICNVNTQEVKDEWTGCLRENPGPTLSVTCLLCNCRTM